MSSLEPISVSTGQLLIIMIKMLMPVKLNTFTHLRALLVLHDRDISAYATRVASLGIISPTSVLRY